MHTALPKTTFVVFFVLAAFIGKTQLQITTQTNAQALAQRLVGDGITVSNVTITGSNLSTGYFKNVGGTQLGLDSGIVLSTGRVLTAGTLYGLNGPQTNLASTTLNTNGDPQLSALINNVVTYDATILEFDFIPIGDTVKFRYVFSSDEYPTFTCSDFNDVFAFFLSGPGIPGTKNLALVPGTNIPVAINSINSGTPGGGNNIATCNAMGPGSPFTQYFVNNTGNANLTLNGHTTILNAISSVQPCQTYHLKIAIADVFDHSYDSGVFLEAKSLISTPLQIINANPVANGLPYMVEGCTNGAIKISRLKKQPSPQTINLFFAGTAINGIDVQTIPSSVTIPANDSIVTVPINSIADNITEGVEQLKIYVSYSSCGVATNVFADSITINLRDQLNALIATQPSACTPVTGSITLNVPATSGAPPYRYSLNGGTFQPGNVFSALAAGNYIVNIQDTSGCAFSSVIAVPLNNTLQVSVFPGDTTVCSGATFTPRVISSNSAATFSWTPSSGLAAPVPGVPFIPAITVPNVNTRYIVTSTLGQCQAKDTINVTSITGATANAGPDVTVIAGDQVQLQGSGSAGTYLWSPATGLSATNVLKPFASPTATTVYTFQVTSPQGCTASDFVQVNVVPYCVKPMEAFTPNGDGINDLWMVTNGTCLKAAKAEVFNRYGAKVFESQDYKNNWDGTYKGDPLPDGTYYFVITYQLINSKTVYLKGNVTILR